LNKRFGLDFSDEEGSSSQNPFALAQELDLPEEHNEEEQPI
jgi:hypothetical protein